MPAWLKELFGDRIQINSLLIVLCFLSVLALSSQSAASYPSYFLAVSMLLFTRRWNDVFEVPVVWCVALLLAWLCLSSIWSTPFSARETLGMFARGLIIFLFVVAMAECELRGLVQRWLGRGLAVVGAVAATGAIAVFLAQGTPDGRLSGLGQLDNPVVAGLVFGAVLILLMEFVLSDGNLGWKIVALVGAGLVVAAIWLSGSRNAWVSTIMGLAFLIGSWRIRESQRFLAAALSLVFLLAVGLLAAIASGRELELLFPRADSFRLDIWAQVMDRIAGAPIIGSGILTPDAVQVADQLFAHPHNMYLAILLQGGVVAGALFILLICWCLVILHRNYEKPSAKLANALLAMALSSYILDGHELVDKVGETWFLFWLPVALALGLSWHRKIDVLREKSDV